MSVSWIRNIGIAVALLAWVGCPSDCSRLCSRQIQCLGDPAGLASADGKTLGADGQREVCRTVCETLQRDAERRESLQDLLQCIDTPCETFASCIKKAAERD